MLVILCSLVISIINLQSVSLSLLTGILDLQIGIQWNRRIVAEKGDSHFTIMNISDPCVKKKKMQLGKRFTFIYSAGTMKDLSLKPFKHTICSIHYNAFRAVVLSFGCTCKSS